VFKKRRDRVKREKDLYYIFFVLDAFPDWRDSVAEQLAGLAAQHLAWFKKCRRNLSALFEAPDSDGVDALLNQRPETAFPGLNDDQFRQYAFSTMSILIVMMDAALEATSRHEV